MSPDQILDLLDQGGVLALFVLAFLAFAREWIVFGRELKAERTEKLFWRDRALQAVGMTEQSLTIAQQLTEKTR